MISLSSKRVSPEQSSQESNGANSKRNNKREYDDGDKSKILQPKLYKSLFPHRIPTLFFEELPFLAQVEAEAEEAAAANISNYDTMMVDKSDPIPTIFFQCSWERDCIRQALHLAGMQRLNPKGGQGTFLRRKILKGGKKKKDPIKTCSLFWTNHLSPRSFFLLQDWQTANHFPNSWCIGRKDRLMRCLDMARRHSKKQSRSIAKEIKRDSVINSRDDEMYYPQGWLLPRDFKAWKKIVRKDSIFILKPPAGRCGQGIRLVKGSKSVPKSRKCILQDYIKNPYLIDNRKFDLRIYVLVSSFDPLRIFLFRDGLTRFATSTYSTRADASKYAFLTNYSINKNNENYKDQEEDGCEAVCGKWSLVKLWSVLEKMEGKDAVAKCRAKIKDLIIKTLIAADAEITPALRRSTRGRNVCFELFGFDIILDRMLKPWLLEVNIAPSLMAKSSLDKRIKGALVSDIFHLIGIVPKPHQREGDDYWSSASHKKKNMKYFLDPSDVCFDELCPEAWEMIYDLEDEVSRQRNFECIYPLTDGLPDYLRYFQAQRVNDIIQCAWVTRERAKYGDMIAE